MNDDKLRAVIFELLAAISYMQSKNMIPPEIDLKNVIDASREMLMIKSEEIGMIPDNVNENIFVPIIEEIIINPQPPPTSMAAYKTCPVCGDQSSKIVHLRERPPKMQCQKCAHKYPWPHKWY